MLTCKGRNIHTWVGLGVLSYAYACLVRIHINVIIEDTTSATFLSIRYNIWYVARFFPCQFMLFSYIFRKQTAAWRESHNVRTEAPKFTAQQRRERPPLFLRKTIYVKLHYTQSPAVTRLYNTYNVQYRKGSSSSSHYFRKKEAVLCIGAGAHSRTYGRMYGTRHRRCPVHCTVWNPLIFS